MIVKLHTSEYTKNVFSKIGQLNGLQAYHLAKIAIALSVRKGPLSEEDFSPDNLGLELNRQTIFGDQDLIFKCLITNLEGKCVLEDEYFPRLVKAHLDRGAKILGNEARYSKNLYKNLCQLDTNI